MWVEGRSDSSTIDVVVGTCGRDGLVIGVISETPAEIQLRARADGGDNGGECAQGQRVHLAEPLGNRRVVDADTFDEIEVRR